MEVLAAAAQQEHLREGASPVRSQGSSEHQEGRTRRKSGRTEAKRSRGSDAAAANGRGGEGGAGGARTKAAVAAEVADAHAERIAGEPETALVAWTADVHGQISAADAAFVAARTAHAQADAARAAARDAFRSDQRSDAKSAEWHARVAAAQQAHEALRDAREALYRLQALAELLSKELQRRRAASTEPAGEPSSGTVAAGQAAAAPGGGAPASAAGSERLLVPPAPQGTKRKRGAPPEDCPFCGHTYTVRDGLSSRLDEAGNRRHLRRCQCRKKTPPCKNCPECKLRPDLMRLEVEAAFDLCQALYACAICACKCPGAGKWIEGDSESRQAFKERTQRRQDELAQLGWQDASAAQPASTALTAGATASVATTAAPSTSLGGQEAVQQRPRRQHQPHQKQEQQQQQPGGSLLTRRLPADIRQELEHIQAARQQGGAMQPPAGQSLSSGWQAPAKLHGHQPAAAAGRTSKGGHADASGVPEAPPASRHHYHHHRHHAAAHSRHEHHHTCSHPHEDCNSDCCSAPTVAVPCTAAAATGAGMVGLGPPLLAAAAGAGSTTMLWEQLAAAGWPTAAMAASLHSLPASSGGPPQQLQQEPPVAKPPELPAEVVALSRQVFEAAAGEHMAGAVCAFLRRQRLTSLSDFEFLELGMLERELAPLGLPALLLNKFLVLGRRAAAGNIAAMAKTTAAAAGLDGGEAAAEAAPEAPAAAGPSPG
ncbi:hypothetical protein ABPG77_001106 [Micractinium sp. CCAP 211/92]